MLLRVWTLFGLLLLIVSGPLHASPSELDRARTLLEQGQWAQVVSLLETDEGASEEDAERRFLKATALLNGGELEGAAALFEGLIRDYPRLPEPYNNLAAIHVRQGRLDEARELLLQAIRTHDSYAAIYDNLTEVTAEKSRRAYAKALVLDDVPKLESLKSLLALSQPRQAESVQLAAIEPMALPAERTAAVIEPVSEPEVVVSKVQEVVQDLDSETVQDKPVVVAINETTKSVPDISPPLLLEPEPTVKQDTEEGTAISDDVMPASVAVEPPQEQAETTKTAVTGDTTPEFSSVAAVIEDVVNTMVETEVAVEAAQAEVVEPAPEVVASVESPAVPAPVSAFPGEIIERLQSWAAAWSAQDVSAYLSYYSEGFRPSTGMDREAWAALRGQRIRRPAWVKVELEGFEQKSADNSRIRLRVKQHYRSPGYQDVTLKEFILVMDAGAWKIASEKNLKISR